MCWQVPLKDDFQGGLQGLDFIISFSASFQWWEETISPLSPLATGEV